MGVLDGGDEFLSGSQTRLGLRPVRLSLFSEMLGHTVKEAQRDWTIRTIAQLVGWGLIFFAAVVFVFGGFVVGEGGGAGREPGTDTIRVP